MAAQDGVAIQGETQRAIANMQEQIAALEAGGPLGGEVISAGDTAWLLTCCALVLLMSLPGLSLFYGGLVRSKNVLGVTNIIFTIAAMITILWMLYGYSISFSTGGMAQGDYNINSFFGTLSRGTLMNVGTHSVSGTIPEFVFVVFQCTFAIITTGIISGAYAERMKFSAVMMFSAIWFTIVYCPMAHQVWSGDGAFILSLGALDFAGGLVVHITSGFAGLLIALYIGPRTAYPNIPKAPHSLVLSHIGACLLWVGWFGFNAGSALAADFAAGQAIMVTITAAAAGILGWMAAELIIARRPSTLGMISGAIAGLVGITPASGFVFMLGALCIGFLTGFGCYFACTTLKSWLNYDDSLDAWGIHGMGGIIGSLLTGIWCAPGLGGVGFGAFVFSTGRVLNIDNIGFQLGIQAVSIVIALAWTFIGTTIAMKVTDLAHGGFHAHPFKLTNVRVEEAVEDNYDRVNFEETGYNYTENDLTLSVNVGPLRGIAGHGLQMYTSSREGTNGMNPKLVDIPEAMSARLAEEGGRIELKVGGDGQTSVSNVTTPSSSLHGGTFFTNTGKNGTAAPVEVAGHSTSGDHTAGTLEMASAELEKSSSKSKSKKGKKK